MKKYSLSVLLLFVIAGCVIYGNFVERSSAQILNDTTLQIEARVDGTVREAGVLESADTLEIRSLVPGHATILSLVEVGSRVRKGDLLIELDSSAINEQQQRQQIQAAVAESEFRQTTQELEIKKLEQATSIEEAEAALRLATLAKEQAIKEGGEVGLQIRTLEKQIALLKEKTNLVKQQQATRGESEHVALQYTLMLLDFESQSEIATEKLELLKTQVLPLQQASLEQNVLSAENQLKLRKLKLQANTEQAKADLKSKELALKIEHDRLHNLNFQRERCNIYAPRDGIVVYANTSSRRAEPVAIEEGASVRERQVLLLMPDAEKLQVTVRVHESKIARVKKGQPVAIRFDALPDSVFGGTVRSVANTPLPGAWPNTDRTTYDVIVSVETPAPQLKIGLTCVAEIDVSK